MGQYVHDFARTLAQTLDISTRLYRDKKSAVEIAQALVGNHWEAVLARIPKNPARRCLLADEGAGRGFAGCVALCEVHGEKPWLEQSMWGAEMVRRIATTAVIAALADNLWQECERQRQRDRENRRASDFRDETQQFLHGTDDPLSSN